MTGASTAPTASPTPTPPAAGSPRDLPAADPAAYVAMQIAAAPTRHRAIATVRASADAIRARTQALPDRITRIDNTTSSVDLSGDSLARIAQLVAALGADYTLDADPEVLDHLCTTAHRILDAAHR